MKRILLKKLGLNARWSSWIIL